MVTTVNSASSRAGVSVFSVAHELQPVPRHTWNARNTMMSRLQQHQQPHKEGSALCHRVTLDSVVPARTDTVHRCPTGKAVGGPQQAPQRRPPTNDNKTQTSLLTNVLSATGVIIHLESYMVAEQVPETGDLRRDVVELRERTRRQQGRSGEVLDHEDDRAERRNPSLRRRSLR